MGGAGGELVESWPVKAPVFLDHGAETMALRFWIPSYT